MRPITRRTGGLVLISVGGLLVLAGLIAWMTSGGDTVVASQTTTTIATPATTAAVAAVSTTSSPLPSTTTSTQATSTTLDPMTEIKAFGAHELDCEFCGGCVQICPVGAITSRLSMYEFRPWMLKRTDSVCGYCGDGCQITFQTKDNALIEINSTTGAGRNNGDLCARGYFGYHVSEHPDRLTSPLIRKGADFQSVQWEEALELVGQRFLEIKAKHGPDAIGGLISGRCTNEDIYVFQKFMRGVIGTNRIDSSVRYGHLNGVHALQRVQGTHRWAVTFEDIESADVLLLVGTNITETNPITGLKVKEAVKRRGAKLITIEALAPAIGSISNIVTLAQHQLTVNPTAYASAILGLLKAAAAQPILDTELQATAPSYFKIGRASCRERV